MTGSIVCTLFEGHYHYGVAGLVNSLYKHGFRGTVYAGYKGSLPHWATGLQEIFLLESKALQMQVTNDLNIVFIPQNPGYHFTNYKPLFLSRLMKEADLTAKQIFYFDPDLVIKCNWNFFEEWVSYGVAIVQEITNHDMPANHPVRQAWKKIIEKNDFEVKRNLTSYLNAGFFGVKRNDLGFADLYTKFVEISVKDYNAVLDKLMFDIDRTNPFYAKDQDAMNIAAMCCDAAISEYGPEAMDFIPGGKVMSHAIEAPKPWKRNYIGAMLKGQAPSLPHKEYWNHANGIINPFSKAMVNRKKLCIKIASFIGRFYRKY